MKKWLSVLLILAILCSMTAFAEVVQKYEYILPMEYTQITRL